MQNTSDFRIASSRGCRTRKLGIYAISQEECRKKTTIHDCYFYKQLNTPIIHTRCAPLTTILRGVLKARLDERAIRPRVPVLGWYLAELISPGAEGACRPAGISEEDVRVFARRGVCVSTQPRRYIYFPFVSLFPHALGSGEMSRKRRKEKKKRDQGTHFRKSICWHRYFSHESVLPPPVSLFSACRLLVRSQSARGEKAVSMLSVTHSVWVPELSESRYSA